MNLKQNESYAKKYGDDLQNESEKLNKLNEKANKIEQDRNYSKSFGRSETFIQTTIWVLFIHFFIQIALPVATFKWLYLVDFIIYLPIIGWGITQLSNTLHNHTNINIFLLLLIIIAIPNFLFLITDIINDKALGGDDYYSYRKEYKDEGYLQYVDFFLYGYYFIEIIMVAICSNIIKKNIIKTMAGIDQ